MPNLLKSEEKTILRSTWVRRPSVIYLVGLSMSAVGIALAYAFPKAAAGYVVGLPLLALTLGGLAVLLLSLAIEKGSSKAEFRTAARDYLLWLAGFAVICSLCSWLNIPFAVFIALFGAKWVGTFIGFGWARLGKGLVR